MTISVKRIRWQCSGCAHLCTMLLDSVVKPVNLAHLAKCRTTQKWRKVERAGGIVVDWVEGHSAIMAHINMHCVSEWEAFKRSLGIEETSKSID